MRTRTVVRQAKFPQQQCEAEKETRTCEKMKNCFEYSWELSDWTSCLVNDGEAECGVGHYERSDLCFKLKEKMSAFKLFLEGDM